MDPIALQRQLRNNSDDLLNFCAELNQWGAQMKRKDEALKSGSQDSDINLPPARNKLKKTTDESETKKQKAKPSRRIKSSDYTAWEKFDVDAACAKLDEEDSKGQGSGELTDEYDEDSQSEAVYEKEKGNKYVKQQKWNEAIKCYTKAIECYGYDPIFYANRALCYLKKQRFQEAETDCTTALRLDKTYVKAYQRRAAAREALNQLTEAHGDLIKVFDYEPNNKESKMALMKLEKKLESFNRQVSAKKSEETQRPKSKFTISRQERKVLKKNVENKSVPDSDINKATQDVKIPSYWPSGNNVELVEKIYKPPHLRTNKPLKRINIVEIDGSDSNRNDIKEPTVALPLPNSDNITIKCDEFKVVERKMVSCNVEAENKFNNAKSNDTITTTNVDEFDFPVPQTSVDFNTNWRLLDKSKSRFIYLKRIDPKNLPAIFKDSLDYDVFSGIIQTLAEDFVEKGLPVYDYVLGLSQVKRFSLLTMFLSSEDKNNLSKLFSHMNSDVSELNIHNLRNKYEL